LPIAIAHMIGAAIGLILLVALLDVMFYCARMLLPFIKLAKPFRTILRVLIILLVAIGVLYVLVVLLGKRQLPGRDGLAADRRRVSGKAEGGPVRGPSPSSSKRPRRAWGQTTPASLGLTIKKLDPERP
jgi:hypothetical protein